ncbi:hypothetical protein ACFQWB_06130 [Paenibacillus thermoaerophilus]|uniref:Dolichyl-phosphate-mannose-protein mannosyltransferase n=1 Tax=Paenibacillus thermoaerophilus TaxID=1215385 RepID=A0ABW2V2R1_9BACL|nr:hypothetical protein [Paenibacillus thermoaerophilus]TMV18217.1 hypothetical protein FE781_04525 [Paenibacillus thermoaerophilus]
MNSRREPHPRKSRFFLEENWPRELPAVVAIAVSAAAMVILLLVWPPIGVADNGDFQRIMGMSGLGYGPGPEEERFFRYFHAEYAAGWEYFGQGYYPSTSWVYTILAVGLESLLTWDGRFDIRWLAALYMLSLLASAALLFRWARDEGTVFRWLLAAFAVFGCSDLAYTAYFNSLFGEPMAFVATLFLFVCALGLISGPDRLRPRWWTGFIVGALGLIGSKVQNAPIGLLLALLALGYGFVACAGDAAWKKRTRIGALIIALFSVGIYAAAPSSFKDINKYQSVFYGILLHSPDPEADLRELGLDPSLAVNAGTNYFETAPIPQTGPEIREKFQNVIGHGDIVRFYLAHPGRLLSQLAKASEYAFTIKPSYLGNYEPEAGKGAGAVSRSWSWWSEWKANALPHHWSVIAGLYAAFLAVCAWEWRLARRLRSGTREWGAYAGGTLAAIGAMSYAVPVVADGFADLEKHLFQFNITFDLMAAIVLAWTVRKLLRPRR